MSDSSRTRRQSKLLLGHRYRLEVAAAIHGLRGRTFYVRELARRLGISDQRVRDNVEHFEAAELLVVESQARGQNPKTYRARSSAYWALCARLKREIDDAKTTDDG